MNKVPLHRTITAVQPMTGLVLWPDHELLNEYQQVITMEYAYCLPSQVVIGKKDNKVQYDWSSFELLLHDISSRQH